jgi:hypothetical protein
MQTPSYTIGPLTFRALPACLAAGQIPPRLQAHAQWSVTAYVGDDPWTETLAGWLAPGKPVTRRRGGGGIACFTGGGVYGPQLAYLRHARSSRQGLRLVAAAAYADLLPRMQRVRAGR